MELSGSCGHGLCVRDLPSDPEPTDAELWRRAVEGDSRQFGTLFDRHARAVYNHCFRRIADWAAAEDLTSVVFLEAWRRRGDISRFERDSALPWLLGIANNVLRNRNRSVRRHRAALARMPPIPIEPDPSDGVATRLDDERRMAEILELVKRLSAADQDVLSLCVWDGLGYDDAAVALGVPAGTVRSRLSRAKARLRELAASHGHEEGECHSALWLREGEA